jgi:hypothetical protein
MAKPKSVLNEGKRLKIGKLISWDFISEKDIDSPWDIREFLEKSFEHFAKLAAKTSIEVDWPLYFRERQIEATLAIAFHEAGGTIISEYPVDRKEHGDEDISKGRLDFLVRYKKSTILFEVKHCYVNLKTGFLRKDDFEKKFNEAVSQLDKIGKCQAKDLRASLKDSCTMATLMVICGHSNKNVVPKSGGKNDRKIEKQLHKYQWKQAKNISKWFARWNLSKSVVDGETQYPEVHFGVWLKKYQK